MDKRGQITVFIVIAIVILLTLGTYFYLQSTTVDQEIGAETDISITAPVPGKAEDLSAYVESCILSTAPEGITVLALQGGSFILDSSKRYVSNDYRYLCKQKLGYSNCVPIVLSRQTMEEELEGYMMSKIGSCVDLNFFREQGFEVQAGDLQVDVSIAADDVVMNVNYPITISSGLKKIEVDAFTQKIDLPLGKLYDLSVRIINREVSKGFFDKDEFMFQHGAEIKIQKHKPYPDIVYELTDDIVFRFALQGKEHVIGEASKLEQVGGCCKNSYDNTCFANTLRDDCSENEMNFESGDCECVGLSEFTESSCNGAECQNCDTTWDYATQSYSGVGRKHGESWCVYDSVVGEGFDYVGTRHYLHSCIDGVEYVEECRDYREELCTSNLINGEKLKGVCRPNRWFDCRSQLSQTECENKDVRDCKWTSFQGGHASYGLQRNVGCHPEVPPGFKHWLNEGVKVCDSASEWRHCDDYNCPDAWVDSLSIYCYMQGDCGNYRNVADQVTKYGYDNEDDTPRSYTYLSGGLTQQGLNYVLNLPMAAREMPVLDGNEFANPGHTPGERTAAKQAYIVEASSWSVDDFIEQYLSSGEVEAHIYSDGECSIWQAPPGAGNCDSCNNKEFKPCTEYQCRSLGQGCIFQEIDGIGQCNTPDLSDTQAPIISFDKTLLTPGYEAVPIVWGLYEGVEVSPALKPFTTITFGFRTNEPARCALTVAPAEVNIPGLLAGSFAGFGIESEYLTTHHMSITAPVIKEAFDRLYESTELLGTNENILQTMNVAQNYDSKIQELEAQYGFDLSSQKQLIDTQVEQYDTDLARDFFISAGGRQFRLFTKCTDLAGNTNDKVFTSFSFDEKGEDNAPPEILKTIPESGNIVENESVIKIFVNELAECKYDFESKGYTEMEYNWNCPGSVFQTTDGLFECSAKIKFSEPGLHRIFTKCRDNPPSYDSYGIKIVKSGSLGVQSTSQNIVSRLSTVTPNLIVADPVKVLKTTPQVNVLQDSNILEFSLSEDVICKYTSNAKASFDEMDVSLCLPEGDGTKCSATLEGEGTFFIRCVEKGLSRNTNTDSHSISVFSS